MSSVGSDDVRATNTCLTSNTFFGANTGDALAFVFNFSSIPAGATIDGLTLTVEGSASSANPSNDFVPLLIDSTGSNEPIPFIGGNVSGIPVGPADSFIVLGGATDTWGGVTLADLLNPNFSVALGVISGSGEVFSVDDVSLTVDYTAPASTPVMSWAGMILTIGLMIIVAFVSSVAVRRRRQLT